LELNRDNLKEGSSLILTINTTISPDVDKTKRINVRKIASIKDLFNSPIKEITLNLTSKKQLKEVQNFLDEKGETLVNINFSSSTEIHKFKLKSLRNIDRKSINILRNKEISLNID
jgi:DNA polymerase-3 subunit alpha